MTDHALDILEFQRTLDWVAGFGATDPGRRAVSALRPRTDPTAVAASLAEVQEVRDFLEDAGDWVFPELKDPTEALRLLGVSGAVLPPSHLYALGTLLSAGRAVRGSLRNAGDRYSGLRDLGTAVHHDAGLEASVVRSVDGEGHVLDTASRDLGRIRSQLRGAHQKVVRHLESVLGGLDDHHRVPDASVTIRDGRYVIPLRREGKGAVGGYIHDESATGATIFVEPPSAIDRMNRVRELEREEAREVQRVLRELSRSFEGIRELLKTSLSALTELDSRVARARAADRWQAACPSVSQDRGLSIVQGRHPLLLTGGIQAVPFDLSLGDNEGVLLVTGPNTGGKTVFLKSVGLLAALTQSGVIPPVGPKTTLPVYDSYFADIGDEQSLEQSLSTFSAHLKNQKELVEAAGDRSLVLIDELGTGTDPGEGEALARALVEELASRGCTAVITSHLGGLKRLAAEGNRIVNGSLQFDAEEVAPTYRFVKGRPGRSYGLAIARRLGIPGYILDRAERYRDDTEARVDHLLETLEVREQESAQLLEELKASREHATRLEETLAGREKTLRASEREHESRALDDARRLLLDARKEVDDAIAELKSRVQAGEDVEEAARRSRQRVERAAREHEAALTELETGQPGANPAPVPVAEGVRVRILDSGAKGTVVSLEGDRALVEVSGLRLKLPLTGLEALADQTVPKQRRGGSGNKWGQLNLDPATEVDLRGRRVDDAEAELVRALDDAVIGDLSELRVIHGKGTGALKKRVAEALERDTRIQGFRPGGPGEGGHGVTVVLLR